MREIKAPEEYKISPNNYVIFTAGSIEMGKAENWQEHLSKALEEYSDQVILLNPRRDDWDSSWVQSIDNPQFNEQVTWELNGLDSSDLIIVYFDPETKSPITLLELGLHVDKNTLVCCPEGYWRKGNVDIVCERYNVPVMETLDELIAQVKRKIEAKLNRAWPSIPE